jgi:hypothetical protein
VTEAIELSLGVSVLKDTKAAVEEAVARAKSKLSIAPSLAIVSLTVEHSVDVFFAAIRSELPDVPVSGLTTSLGMLGADGVTASVDGVVAVLLFASPNGSVTFDVGGSAITRGARDAGRAAAQAIAKRNVNKQPAVLLFTASPGAEEDALAGVGEVFPGVPAYGGTAADHAIAGQWCTFSNVGATRNGVVVTAFFGKVKVGGAFVVPYESMPITAIVTAAEGRKIKTLDGKPAASVLGQWVGDSIDDQVEQGGVVLAQTALSPIGIRRTIGRNTYLIPTHPSQIIQPEGSVGVFTLPKVGDEVCLLKGTVESLTGGLDVLITNALANGKLSRDKVAGGVLIYCAGCAGAVGEALHDALRTYVGKGLPDVPLLGLCTFGEQCYVQGFGNAHYNLSLILVLFGKNDG